MDIQTKILNALADFDDLLIRGLSIDEALSIAASDNLVSERALEARASRRMSLEERRHLVVKRAEHKQDAVVQAPISRASLKRRQSLLRAKRSTRVGSDPAQYNFDFDRL